MSTTKKKQQSDNIHNNFVKLLKLCLVPILFGIFVAYNPTILDQIISSPYTPTVLKPYLANSKFFKNNPPPLDQKGGDSSTSAPNNNNNNNNNDDRFDDEEYVFVSKVYPYVSEDAGPEYWDWKRLGSLDHCKPSSNYQLYDKIGSGKYSNVYYGKDISKNQQVVVKVIKPDREARISREMMILQHLQGGPNIITYYGCYRDSETNALSLVFERLENKPWKETYPDYTYNQVQHLFYRLLEALDYSHSKGIIHRDVKPHNLIFNKDTKQLKLLDWGLSEFYRVHDSKSYRVASRYYKPPEILLRWTYYDYAFDIWSVGCVLAIFLFRDEVFFYGSDDHDQLSKIADVLGGPDLAAYAKKIDVNLSLNEKEIIDEHLNVKRQPLVEFAMDETFARKEAIDLIERMLVYDHEERITAKEALAHPFFDSIRHEL